MKNRNRVIFVVVWFIAGVFPIYGEAPSPVSAEVLSVSEVSSRAQATVSGFPTGSFTVEGSVYFAYYPNTSCTLLNKGELCMIPLFYNAGYYYIYAYIATGVPGEYEISYSRVWYSNVMSEWHHVAVGFDATSGDINIFLDGVSQTVYSSGSTTYTPPPSTDAIIGYDGNSATFNRTFCFDEVRVSSTIRYTSNFTPPTVPFTSDSSTSALWHFDDGQGATTFADSSSNGNDLNGYNGAVILADTSDLKTLEVISSHGVATPVPGTYTNQSGAALTNTVTSPDTQGSTQYVCTGWSMTGNTPVSGATNSMTMTHTNDSTLTWNWQTNYWLNTEAGANGFVDEQDQWVNSGSNVTVTATADDQYQFAGWSGNTQGDTNNPIMTVTLDQPRMIAASFSLIPDDMDDDGIPNDWEAHYYGGTTNANPDALCSNGVNTILEAYIAGLNPTNPASCFELSNLRNILQWEGVSGRVYSVWWTSNLLSGFQSLESNIPWTGNIFTDTTYNAEEKGFYKIDVQLDE